MDRGQETTEVKQNSNRMSGSTKMNPTSLTTINPKLTVARERNARNRDHLSTAFRVYKQLYGEEAAREAFIEIASNIVNEDEDATEVDDRAGGGVDGEFPQIALGPSTDDSVSSTKASVDGPTAPRYISYRQSLSSQKDKERLLDSSSHHTSDSNNSNKKRTHEEVMSTTPVFETNVTTPIPSCYFHRDQDNDKIINVTGSELSEESAQREITEDDALPRTATTITDDDETSQAIGSTGFLSIAAVASNVTETTNQLGDSGAELPRYIKYRASLTGKPNPSGSDRDSIVRIGSAEEMSKENNDYYDARTIPPVEVSLDTEVSSSATPTPTTIPDMSSSSTPRYAMYRASLTQSARPRQPSAYFSANSLPSVSESFRQENEEFFDAEQDPADDQQDNESTVPDAGIVAVGSASAGVFASTPKSDLHREMDLNTTVSTSKSSSASPNRYISYRSALNNKSWSHSSNQSNIETEPDDRMSGSFQYSGVNNEVVSPSKEYGMIMASSPPQQSIHRDLNDSGADAASILSDLNTVEKSVGNEKSPTINSSIGGKTAATVFPSFAEQILGAVSTSESDDGMANSFADQSGQSYADHSAVTPVISNSVHKVSNQRKSPSMYLADDAASSFDSDSSGDAEQVYMANVPSTPNRNPSDTADTSDIVSVSSSTEPGNEPRTLSNVQVSPLISNSSFLNEPEGSVDGYETGIEVTSFLSNVARDEDSHLERTGPVSEEEATRVSNEANAQAAREVPVGSDQSANVISTDGAPSPTKTASSGTTSDSNSSTSSSDDDSSSSSSSNKAEPSMYKASLNTSYDSELIGQNVVRSINNPDSMKQKDQPIPVVTQSASTGKESIYKDFDYGEVTERDPENPVEYANVSKEKEKDSDNGNKEQFKRAQADNRRTRCKYALLLLVMIALPVGIGLIVVLGRNSSTSSASPEDAITPTTVPVPPAPTLTPTRLRGPSSAPESFPTVLPTSNELFDLLASLSTDDGAAMSTAGTPQNDAFVWLSNDPSIAKYTDSRKVQRYALSTFFLSTEGANWTNNTHWFTYTDECEWFSRSSRTENCDDNGEYRNLDLGYNEVSGTLPPEIGMLTSLSRVIISGGIRRTLIGALPTELGLLKSMGTFLLQGNSIYGRIPTELGNWGLLDTLDLSLNNIFGTIPTQIGQWQVLRFLALSGNRLEGTLPETLNALTNLERLSVGDNTLIGAVPSSIDALTNLKVFNLEQNRIQTLPIQIGNMSSLETLTAHENELSGRLYTVLGNLGTLRRLSLNGNSFTGPIPTSIGNLSELRYLDLSYNNLTLSIPTELGQLSDILTLQLESNRLTGVIPVEFENLSSASLIRVDQNSLSGTVPLPVCATFRVEFPTFYADCGGGTEAEVSCPESCCTFCCTDGEGCECMFTGTPYELLCYR